jgi:uncharacterized membrane-anchored protein
VTERRPELVRFAIALLIPLAVLLLLIGRGELITRSGMKWRVRITGYDPRDLVHGHYLRYQLSWRWADRDGSQLPQREPDSVFCLNLDGDGGRMPEPKVTLVPREERSGCKSWFPVETEERLNRFFIPEGKGRAFENAVRSETCYVVLAVSRTGQVVVEDLLIKDTSWRDALKD